EARYPRAIEQNYAVAKWIVTKGKEKGLDAEKLAIAGDSVGGNMSAALTLLAKERGDVKFVQQVLFYPVTDAAFDTGSYHEFATGYFLQRDGMKWFWDQYTTDEKQRNEITASPLRATTEQLKDLPPALVITAEADVLRDDGEADAGTRGEAGGRAAAGRGAHPRGPVRRNHPRLRDAGRAARHPRRQRRHRPGHPHAQERAALTEQRPRPPELRPGQTPKDLSPPLLRRPLLFSSQVIAAAARTAAVWRTRPRAADARRGSGAAATVRVRQPWRRRRSRR